MSNFSKFTPEWHEEFERKQLERRLDAKERASKGIESFVMPRSMTMGVAHKDGGPVTNRQKVVGMNSAIQLKPRKPRKAKGETANAITANVIRAINLQPKCVAYRINNVGIWDEKKKIHRRANTQRGIFDVAAIIKGRAAWFEIKAGNDKPSKYQLIFQQEVINAGGIAEFIHSTDEFLKLFTKILLDL